MNEKTFQLNYLPLKIHVTLGKGAPNAWQVNVTSFPSSDVMFWGKTSMTGDEAMKN